VTDKRAALGSAVIARVANQGRDDVDWVLNVALVLAAAIVVGAGIAWLVRSTRAALRTMVLQVNAGIAVLARNSGLELFAAPDPDGITPDFSEARGLFRGQRVVVRVETRNTAELLTTITFPAAVPAVAEAVRAHSDVYDGIKVEGDRVTLYLERRTRWMDRLRDPLDYDKCPEWDPARLQEAVEVATAFVEAHRVRE
jgi:hypothetical protein